MVTVDRAYSGAAAATIINTAMTPTTPGVGGTITVADDSGYPSSGKFEIVVDRGQANEESVLISSRSGTTFTIGQRGYDGTVASSHTSGQATCEAELSGRSVQLFVDHVDDVEAAPHSTKLPVGTTAGHDVEARHQFGAALGTPVAPTSVGTSVAVGTGNNPSKEDHQHDLGVGSIDAANLFVAGVVDAAAIGADQVGTSEIAPLAVTAAKIANDTITATQVAANAIGASELADNAVDTNAIANLAVTTGKIADDAVTDAKIENDFARGIIAQQRLTASEGAAHSASGATDMLLNNVPVVQNHVYAIHIHSPTNLTPGGSIAEWNVNLHINGALYATLCTVIAETTSATWHPTVEGTVYWTAPTTQSTDDFTVEVVEVSGSFTLLLSASATAPRWLTITDLGVI